MSSEVEIKWGWRQDLLTRLVGLLMIFAPKTVCDAMIPRIGERFLDGPAPGKDTP